MIYVMKSSAYKDGTDEHEDIIKIGYTGEESRKARIDTYITENPTIKVLYLIPGGTERDEKNLHYYFRRFRKYGHEWFEYNQEIIDFFETHKTKESLEEVENWSRLSVVDLEKAKQNKENNSDKLLFVQVAAKELISLSTIYTESGISNFLWLNINMVEEVIETKFPGKLEVIKEKLREVEEETERIKEHELELQQAYDHLLSEFDKDKNFIRRMKLLCDTYFTYPEFYQKYANSPLPYMIPIEYQNYITILGFEKIRSLSYQESEIIKEIETLRNLKNVDIYSLFSVGDKYTKKQIKETLSEFYKDNNIHKTPKASDLDEYFILKSIKLKVDEKWENGFEVVAKKIKR